MHKNHIVYLLLLMTIHLYGMKTPHVKAPNFRKIFFRSLDYIRNHLPFKASTASDRTKNIDSYFLDPFILELCSPTDTLDAICYNIRCFSQANKKIYEYCTQESFAQSLITKLAIEYHRSDLYVARRLHKNIHQKMIDLSYIAKMDHKIFTQQDLQDPWYLNATYRETENMHYLPLQTLLLITVSHFDAEKTQMLINAGASCNPARCRNPIACLARPNYLSHFSHISNPQFTPEKYLATIKVLLVAGINPDSCSQINGVTLLHRAAYRNNKECAQLLLQHNANPYTTYCDISRSTFTAFDLERGEPKGWLKTMYDEIKPKAQE